MRFPGLLSSPMMLLHCSLLLARVLAHLLHDVEDDVLGRNRRSDADLHHHLTRVADFERVRVVVAAHEVRLLGGAAGEVALGPQALEELVDVSRETLPRARL